jgi:hypothetical protein
MKREYINIREGNTVPDKVILSKISDALSKSLVMMAKDMKENKTTLYQVTTGRNKLSARLIYKIIQTYEEVNPDYIKRGEGKPTIELSDDIFKEEIFMKISLMEKKMEIMSEQIGSLVRLIRSNY